MFPHRLLVLFVVLSVSVGNAQKYLPLTVNCFSPPPPPAFKPVDITSLPNGQRSAGYKIPFDTIRFNSNLGTKALDVVIVFDGVINNQQIAIADQYVDSLLNSLQSVAQYNPRFKYFNVYRIAKLSNEEGAAWGFTGDTIVNNRYGSRFNAYGLPRLILPEKYDTLFADVDEFVPEHDLVLNLCYDKKYGGSGWTLYDERKVATFTIDQQTGWHLGDEVACHEMQHIMPFAGHGFLGDEYEDSLACSIYDTITGYYRHSPNFTGDTIAERKWDHCMGLPGVGFYPYAGICTGNYRPTTNCLMHQTFGFPAFCPVCRENSTAWLDSMFNPVYYASPSPVSYTASYTFKVNVDTPTVNTFRYQWLVDDTVFAVATDSFAINLSLLDNSNNHTLKFVCTDIDPYIIDTNLRRPWITTWNLLTKDTTVGIHTLGEGSFSLSPNPAVNEINIRCSSLLKSVCITDVLGQIVFTDENVNEQFLRKGVSSFAKGVYILTANTCTGLRFTRKLVISF